MRALVSIITPTYNSSKYIRETIASVQNQTYENWELIIVDDCSKDDTVAIVEALQKDDDRIRLIVSEVNGGSGVARNTGTEASKGDYIAFLDADDLWKPQKLEVQIDFMEAKGYPFTFSFYDAMDEDGNLLKKLITAPNPLSYSQLLFSNYVGNLTGIYSTKYFGRIPISSIRKRQDWILWLTILKKMKVAYPVPESLAFYRMHDNSISSSKVGLLKFNYLVYRHFGKSALIASLYMLKFLWIHFLVKPKYSISYL